MDLHFHRRCNHRNKCEWHMGHAIQPLLHRLFVVCRDEAPTRRMHDIVDHWPKQLLLRSLPYSFKWAGVGKLALRRGGGSRKGWLGTVSCDPCPVSGLLCDLLLLLQGRSWERGAEGEVRTRKRGGGAD